MQTTTVRTALSALFCTAALAAVGTVQAAPAPGDGNPKELQKHTISKGITCDSEDLGQP
ncbi:hypothetical protein [Duodenibacillus massiliensis]|uniref:hypothetical protein n=1 Tax=Duodenibacillus massiliensis TaxID=1852381 RepID=UPI00307B5EBA